MIALILFILCNVGFIRSQNQPNYPVNNNPEYQAPQNAPTDYNNLVNYAVTQTDYNNYAVTQSGYNGTPPPYVENLQSESVQIQNDSLPISHNADSSVNLDELLLVQVVHRHGERSSLFQIPTAGEVQRLNSPTIEAQLTSNGIRQMYEYGQFIRTRYHSFFEDGERASSQRIKVISSATDRTISSAQALIAGLLPPNGTRRQWNTPLGEHWNPFPVYTRPRNYDALLLNYDNDCPMFSVMRGNISELPIAAQLQSELQGFKNTMIRATGITDYNFFETSTRIHDALIHQHRYGNGSGYPSWMNHSIYETLDRIVDTRMHLIVGGNRDRIRTRFRVGHLLKEIVDRMNTAAQNYLTGKENGLKMVLYSGHDENVAGILAALDLYNYTLSGPNFGVPKFTASLIFEYYRNSSVRILVKNDPNNMAAEPEVLKPPHCEVYCPLDKFTSAVSDLLVSEAQWKSECGLNNTASSSQTASGNLSIGLPECVIIAGVLVAFSLLLLAAAIVGVWRWRGRRETYRKPSPVFAHPLTGSAPKDLERGPPSPLVYVRPTQKLLTPVEDRTHDSRM